MLFWGCFSWSMWFLLLAKHCRLVTKDQQIVGPTPESLRAFQRLKGYSRHYIRIRCSLWGIWAHQSQQLTACYFSFALFHFTLEIFDYCVIVVINMWGFQVFFNYLPYLSTRTSEIQISIAIFWGVWLVIFGVWTLVQS